MWATVINITIQYEFQCYYPRRRLKMATIHFCQVDDLLHPEWSGKGYESASQMPQYKSEAEVNIDHTVVLHDAILK